MKMAWVANNIVNVQPQHVTYARVYFMGGDEEEFAPPITYIFFLDDILIYLKIVMY